MGMPRFTLARRFERSRVHPRRAAFVAALVALSLAVAGPASAAPGDLDTTFSGDGKVTTNFTPKAEWAIDLAIQADGKIVAAGVAGFGGSNAKFALARYNTNGSLDAKFSGDGKVTTDFTPKLDAANSVAIQPGGKIVAAGVAGFGGSNAKFALARYNTNGSLDATFSGDGKVTTDFTAGADGANRVVIQADQRIVAAGGSNYARTNGHFALARYNTNGSPDTTFSGDGKLNTDFTSKWDYAFGVAVGVGGKIVAGGEAGFLGSNPQFALARYNLNGSLDGSFSVDGKVTTDFTSKEDFGEGVEIQPDGNIVAAGGSGLGGSNPKFALARYLAT